MTSLINICYLEKEQQMMVIGHEQVTNVFCTFDLGPSIIVYTKIFKRMILQLIDMNDLPTSIKMCFLQFGCLPLE